MGTLGGQEMLVILVLAVLIFGPKELPKVVRTISRAMTEFRQTNMELSREPGGQEVLVNLVLALALLLALLLFATKFLPR